MQKPSLNAHVDVSSGDRGRKLGLSLHLHPYFAYDQSMHLCRFAKTALVDNVIVPKSPTLAFIT